LYIERLSEINQIEQKLLEIKLEEKKKNSITDLVAFFVGVFNYVKLMQNGKHHILQI
jgi:hypothetical protein